MPSLVLTGMRYEKDFVASLFQGVPDMEESSTYQLIMERGELRNEKRTLLRLGRKKFGEPDSATLSLVERLTDADRLHALTARLLDVTSWEELLS